MIKGLGPSNGANITPRLPERGLRAETSSGSRATDRADFADQLKGPTRNERNEKPGRDLDAQTRSNREGSRSTEREKDPNSSTHARSERRDERQEEPRDVRRDGPRDVKKKVKSDEPKRLEQKSSETNEQRVTPVANRDTIVHRKPVEVKGEEGVVDETSVDGSNGAPSTPATGSSGQAPLAKKPGQDVKLPDFFSKASIASVSGKNAAQPAAEKTESLPQAESVMMLSQMKQDGAVSKQQAMEQFLQQMNDELGIPPEQVLQAFAQMPTQMLEAPAHESIGAFVQNLEIPPQGQARAAQLYANLLERTGQSELSEKLAGMNEGVSFEVMSPRDAALKKLDASLNTLNNTFFRKDGTLLPPDKAQASLEHMDAEISNLMRKKNTQFDNKPVGKDDDGKAALLSTTDFAKSGGLGAMLAAGGEGALDSADAAPVASAASGATAGGSSSLGLMSASSLASPLGAMSSGLGDSGAESDMFGGDSSGASAGGGKASAVSSKTDAAFAQQMKSASAESSMAREMKATDKAPARADAPPVDPNSPNSQALAQGASQAPKAAAVVAGPAGMITNRPATAAEEQENVRELIKEAQVMVKRGGGEMKLEMRPEGMGQVHLRVAVDNGQVSVQMLTESESAKRLIEKGLGELKTSLAAHELKVEHMRVDVGSDIQKQMDQQGTQDQQRQNARAFAQDFMQNFRDENQGFRQGLLENPGWKQYGRKQGSNEIAPEPVAKARARTKDDKRLDLVA